MYGPPTLITEDDTINGTIRTNLWEEHQRRQRSIRILMMVLMFLILLDGEEPPRRKNLRNRKSKPFPKLEKSIWNQRRRLDNLIGTYRSEQKEKLIELNNGVDETENVRKFTLEHLEKESATVSMPNKDNNNNKKESSSHIVTMEDAKQLLEEVEEEDRLVYHYPTNSSGFYRGTWNRRSFTDAKHMLTNGAERSTHLPEGHEATKTSTITREQVLNLFPDDFIGLQFLPPGYSLEGNLTTSFNRSLDHNATTEAQKKIIQTRNTPKESLQVSNEDGVVYMQLYSRSVPGMIELSLIDGIVRLVDVTNGSIFSLQKDLLMRVRGVLFHSMGKLCLVGNDDQGIRRNVLVMKQSDNSSTEKRKLYDVTNEIVDTYKELYEKEIVGGPMWEKYMQSSQNGNIPHKLPQRRLMLSEDTKADIIQDHIGSSSIVETYPFVAESDRVRHSIGEPPAVVIRSTPEILMKNGRSCEFVLDFNITERQCPVSTWRSMMKRIMVDLYRHDPTSDLNEKTDDNKKTARGSFNMNSREKSKGNSKQDKDEVMVTQMLGTIYSEQCEFFSTLNVTAHRTDMEQVTGKAINYCFFMFIACLAQAVFLLRQMIYSQPQSSAIRVSIVCIGWQTALDALLCLEHLWLCFYIQPVATAFAMVAFLKAMIFMAIEMKYCVMIMKARMESRRTNVTQDEIRQQTARLYFKFYAVLVSSTFLLYNVGVRHLTSSILLSYSFWLPQIILNIVTEARKPLHENYIQGMSITRLIAPLYTYGMPNNFFKELEPEFQTDFLTCQLLVIWLGIQAAILWGQSKYGARFMIPSRFLPPKFDYHRPIPSSLLPQPLDRLKSSTEERESSSLLENDAVIPGHTAGGPRNRKVKSDIGKTTVHTVHNSTCDRPTLDCVICYNDIDIGDREKYMLAPCDHIFHKECLTQWMEVKMECPVCRTDLPAL